MMRKAAIAVLILNFVAPVLGAGGEQDKELAQAQGKWVTADTKEGKTYRLVKEINGNKEKFSVYHKEELVYAHTVDFELTKTDHVRIFTYRNLTVTHGPSKGQVRKEPSSYIYQIRGDKWYSAHGLMNGDTREPAFYVHERVQKE